MPKQIITDQKTTPLVAGLLSLKELSNHYGGHVAVSAVKAALPEAEHQTHVSEAATEVYLNAVKGDPTKAVVQGLPAVLAQPAGPGV